MFELLLIGPLVAIPLSVYLMQTGVRDSTRFQWWRIATGLVLVGLTAIRLFVLSAFGDLAVVFAYMEGLLLTGLSIVGGVWMWISLPAQRKLTALLFFPVVPATIYFSIQAGSAQSPESKTERSGDLIIEALGDYHANEGSYPESVEYLEPDYLTEVPPATTNGYANWYKGWLYTADDDDFWLGYTYPSDRWNTLICYYSSQSPEWECDVWGFVTEWGGPPLMIPPTLQPCFDDGEWIDTAACRQELEY